MSPRRILALTFIFVAALSFGSLILPRAVAIAYVGAVPPLALLLGFGLSLKVASTYAKDLKKAFLFLSLFLLLYVPANILALWKFLYSRLGDDTVFLAQVLQFADYAMLITSCIYVLRALEVRRMNRYGWMFLGAAFAFSVYVIVYGIPSLIDGMSGDPAVAVSRMMIRVFDMAVVLMLLPVLLLYIQNLRSKAKESVTFVFIMGGLIVSLLSTYVFQIIKRASLDAIAADYVQKGSVLDAFYAFGYLIVAAGLYAHVKYNEWAYDAIDRAITTGLSSLDVDDG
ncbi:MAG: hypothetical protein HY671_05690 [Chloroflexi bacterium]|nr:hypothetical protein [Chloroflexota bacterium]